MSDIIDCNTREYDFYVHSDDEGWEKRIVDGVEKYDHRGFYRKKFPWGKLKCTGRLYGVDKCKIAVIGFLPQDMMKTDISFYIAALAGEYWTQEKHVICLKVLPDAEIPDELKAYSADHEGQTLEDIFRLISNTIKEANPEDVVVPNEAGDVVDNQPRRRGDVVNNQPRRRGQGRQENNVSGGDAQERNNQQDRSTSGIDAQERNNQQNISTGFDETDSGTRNVVKGRSFCQLLLGFVFFALLSVIVIFICLEYINNLPSGSNCFILERSCFQLLVEIVCLILCVIFGFLYLKHINYSPSGLQKLSGTFLAVIVIYIRIFGFENFTTKVGKVIGPIFTVLRGLFGV